MATSTIKYVPQCKNLGTLPTNTDLNTVTEWSVSKLISGNTYTNAPSGVTWGLLETIHITTLMIQRLSSNNLYYRYYGNDEWSAWKKYTIT